MRPKTLLPLATALALVPFLAPRTAEATFHLMQIEQVVGGVCGDVSSQAVQLRLRLAGQRFVTDRQLVAYDAAGVNPVVVITFPGDAAFGAAGRRILVGSSAYAADQSPALDFTMDNLIPASYLAAGRLTFEDGMGTIYWSLAWGGASYTGATTGNTANDADGQFGPSYGGVLPSSTSRALLFQGATADLSSSNAADYALTPDAATFTNNTLATGTLTDCLFGDGFESGDLSLWSP